MVARARAKFTSAVSTPGTPRRLRSMRPAQAAQLMPPIPITCLTFVAIVSSFGLEAPVPLSFLALATLEPGAFERVCDLAEGAHHGVLLPGRQGIEEGDDNAHVRLEPRLVRPFALRGRL